MRESAWSAAGPAASVMARSDDDEFSESTSEASDACTRTNVSTTRGSYIVLRRSVSTRTASRSDSLGRYGRSEVRASKQSTTERIRAPIGMADPDSPSGYPEPSQFSWWCRTIGTTGYG